MNGSLRILTPRATMQILFIGITVAIATTGVTETDIWGHIKFGGDIIRMRHVPAMDPYSFTTDQPWVNHEWASQVIFASAFDSGGVPMLAVVRATAIAAIALLVSVSLRRAPWPLSDALVVAVLLTAAPLERAVRPQVFSLPLYTLTLILIEEESLWLPVVFSAWANLHGGWMLGLAAVGVRTFTGLTRRRLTLLVSSALATLLNPYGVGLWMALFEAVHRGWTELIEWQPVYTVSWHSDLAMTWAVTTVFGIWVAWRERPVGLFPLVWTACVAAAALRASRQVPFFVLTAVVLLGGRIRGRSLEIASTWHAQVAAATFALALGGILAAWTVLAPTIACLPRAQPSLAPDSGAVTFARDTGLNGRVVVYFDWGLYAIWHLGDRIKVSIDNRRETVYSDAVVRSHQRFYAGGDPEYATRLRAAYVWLPPTMPVVAQLERRGWFRIYQGSRSIILGRSAVPLTVGAPTTSPPCFPAP